MSRRVASYRAFAAQPATTAADGLMSAADKAKLDVMLESATAGTGAGLVLAEATAGGASIFRIRAPSLTGDRLMTPPDEALSLAAWGGTPNTAYLIKTAAGVFATIRYNESAVDPATTDNTAAGFPTWSTWRQTATGTLWTKVNENAGNATWAPTAAQNQRAALNDNQAAAADVSATLLSFPYATFIGVQVEYGIYRGTANSRTGILRIAGQDNTDTAVLTDTSVEVGTTGVTLTVATVGTSFRVQYTSTATGTAPRIDWNIRRLFTVN